MKGKKLVLVSILGVSVALGGCADSNSVDGKAIVEVPQPSGPPAICYLLEIEHTDGTSGEEGADQFKCVSKQTYDKNHEGEEYIP